MGPPLCGPCADYGRGIDRGRGAWSLLPGSRRFSRHDPEPFAAGDGYGGDGAERQLPRGLGPRRAIQAAALHSADAGRGSVAECGAWAIWTGTHRRRGYPGIPAGAWSRRQLTDRYVRGIDAVRGELA